MRAVLSRSAPMTRFRCHGELGRAVAIAAEGDGVLILGTEVGRAFLSGHAGAGHQRVLCGRIPGGVPRASSATSWSRPSISGSGEEERLGHADPLHRPGGGGHGPEPSIPSWCRIWRRSRRRRWPRRAICDRCMATGLKMVYAGLPRSPGSAGDRCRRSPSPIWSELLRLRGVDRAGAADGLHPGAAGAAAAPQRGGRAAAGAAGGARGRPAGGSRSSGGWARCRRSRGR